MIVEQLKPHTAEQVLTWANDLRGDGGQALVVEMLESYAALLKVKTEQPSLSDEREEDEYVIDRLSTILAGVSIAFKGEELPLHRHSYHDLAELAKAKMLEIDLLNHQIAELSAAQRQDSDTKDAERYRLIRSILHMSVKQQNAITEAMDILPDDDGIPTIEQFDAVVDAGIAYIANGAPK